MDFSDPLFAEIGNAFIALQTKEYGTDHIYNCDTFNELTPPSSDPQYLKSASRNVFTAMTGADPEAIWLMQGLTSPPLSESSLILLYRHMDDIA